MPPISEYATQRWIAFDSALGMVKSKRLNELDSMRKLSENDTVYRTLTVEYFSIFHTAYVTDPAHIARERGSIAALAPQAIRNRSVHSVRRYLGTPWNYLPLLKNIEAPAVVIEGEKTNMPLDATREYVKNITGSTMVLIPNAGHQNWLDQPDAVLDALDKFLKQLFRNGLKRNSKYYPSRRLVFIIY